TVGIVNAAVDCSGRNQIIERDNGCALRFFDGSDCSQRNHVSVLVAHVIRLETVGFQTIRRVGLRLNHVVMSELREYVDKARSEVALDGLINIVRNYSEGFRLSLVYVDGN